MNSQTDDFEVPEREPVPADCMTHALAQEEAIADHLTQLQVVRMEQ